MKTYLVSFDCFSIEVRDTTEFNALCQVYDQCQVDNIEYPADRSEITIVENTNTLSDYAAELLAYIKQVIVFSNHPATTYSALDNALTELLNAGLIKATINRVGFTDYSLA